MPILRITGNIGKGLSMCKIDYLKKGWYEYEWNQL